MELYERRDYIQVDYRENNGGFVVSALADEPQPLNGERAGYDFHIMKRFNENLAGAIMFAVGAMSAIRLFLSPQAYSTTGFYRPAEFMEVFFTSSAKDRIRSKKYRTARLLYPDLKKLG